MWSPTASKGPAPGAQGGGNREGGPPDQRSRALSPHTEQAVRHEDKTHWGKNTKCRTSAHFAPVY